MKNLIILVFLVLSYQGFSQILPSSHGVHHKKSSGGGGVFSVDLSTIGSGIILSNDNKTITSNQSQGSGCPWRSVYLSPTISLNTGVKSYTVTVDSYQDQDGNGFDMALGVTPSNSAGDNFAFNYIYHGGVGAFAYIAQTGKRYGYGNCLGGNEISYGLSYGQGDVIKVEFDTNNKTITFYKNNVSQGVAYTSDCFTSNNYHFAIAICNSNFQVTLDWDSQID